MADVIYICRPKEEQGNDHWQLHRRRRPNVSRYLALNQDIKCTRKRVSIAIQDIMARRGLYGSFDYAEIPTRCEFGAAIQSRWWSLHFPFLSALHKITSSGTNAYLLVSKAMEILTRSDDCCGWNEEGSQLHLAKRMKVRLSILSLFRTEWMSSINITWPFANLRRAKFFMAHKREEDIIRKREKGASEQWNGGRSNAILIFSSGSRGLLELPWFTLGSVGLANCLNPPNAGTYPLHCGSLKSGMIWRLILNIDSKLIY